MRESVELEGASIGDSDRLLPWGKIQLQPLMWKPPGLEPSDLGWLWNLLDASLQSEYPGYLMVEDPATLRLIAGAKHPETWKRHGSKVLAHFDRCEMHGHEYLYFPPLVDAIEKQKKDRRRRSRFPKHQQESEGGVASSLPLAFDSAVEVGFKPEKDKVVNMENDPKSAGQHLDERRMVAKRILTMLGLSQIDSNLKSVEFALSAESAYTGRTFQEVAEAITKAAIEDRDRGVAINAFYFNDHKWRSSNGGHKPSASQQRSERTKRNILDGIAAEISRRNQSNGYK